MLWDWDFRAHMGSHPKLLSKIVIVSHYIHHEKCIQSWIYYNWECQYCSESASNGNLSLPCFYFHIFMYAYIYEKSCSLFPCASLDHHQPVSFERTRRSSTHSFCVLLNKTQLASSGYQCLPRPSLSPSYSSHALRVVCMQTMISVSRLVTVGGRRVCSDFDVTTYLGSSESLARLTFPKLIFVLLLIYSLSSLPWSRSIQTTASVQTA